MPRTADKFAFFVELALQQEENKYDDSQLAELMKEHFPNFAGEHMIAAYRRDYNAQKRPAFAKPDSPLLKYVDGEPVPEGKRGPAKAKAAPEAEAGEESEEDFKAEVAAGKKAKAGKTVVKTAAKAKPVIKKK